MGTVTPPAVSVAKSAMTHSGLFSERIATLSPGFRPRAWKPNERRRTVVSNSAVEMDFQAPCFLTIILSAFLCVRQAWRKRRLRVVTA